MLASPKINHSKIFDRMLVKVHVLLLNVSKSIMVCTVIYIYIGLVGETLSVVSKRVLANLLDGLKLLIQPALFAVHHFQQFSHNDIL